MVTRGPARRAAIALAIQGALAASASAAPAVDFLGPAREISRSSSASRDVALPALHVAPHRVLTGGGEIALVSLRGGGLTWRFAFFGMLELESAGTTDQLLPFPTGDIAYWRGHWGYQVSAALDRVGARWCDGCALELTLGAHHESEHHTAPNDGGATTDYSDRPHVGNFVLADVAARRPFGRVEPWLRAQDRVFLPHQSGWSQAPAIEGGVRWRVRPRLHPFASAFAEYGFGVMGIPDVYRLRALAGVIVPSSRGDLYLYLSAEQGNRQGLAVFTEERALGAGLRLAFW